MPDPLPSIAALPRGLCGVVLRHDGVDGRARLARAAAALCHARGIALSIAGDWRLAAALGAGVHLRGGRGRPVGRLGGRWNTASAHDGAQLRRGLDAGALVFLSPLCPTVSHPGGRSLGPARWARLARGQRVLALGGVDGGRVGVLRLVGAAGAGAIGALAWRGGCDGLGRSESAIARDQ